MQVAKVSAGRFNPNVRIEAYHANIKDDEFNVAWFKSFGIVFNALDNLDARRHVNKMCLAADVPLIESGTTGFNGQVQVIRKVEYPSSVASFQRLISPQGVSQCYDCTPKATPKSFPVCTIRSTPTQPIHCIVWAKSYLFTEIFGTSEDDAPELDHTKDSENREEIGNLQKEAQALKRIRMTMGSNEFPRLVFDKVFKEDVDRLRSMEDMWKNKKPPVALDYDTLSQEALGVGSEIAQKDQLDWTPAENFAVFIDSIRRLSDRLEDTRVSVDAGNAPPILTFDKDDVDTLDFVAASANLRSAVFGIDRRSKFDIKRTCPFPHVLVYTNLRRNGRQHHSRNRHHKCYDCVPVRTARLQSAARGPVQGQDGLPCAKRHRASHDHRNSQPPEPRVCDLQCGTNYSRGRHLSSNTK